MPHGRVGLGAVPVALAGLDVRDIADVDLFLSVPGVAFDRRGNRLGRGQAWYDRVIHHWGSRATPVGLAYEFQVIDRVPVDPWEERVLFVLTQERFIDCQKMPEQTKQVC